MEKRGARESENVHKTEWEIKLRTQYTLNTRNLLWSVVQPKLARIVIYIIIIL